ncbi:hypothetical protein NXG27_04140 [Megasphaera paucivorans]|uniref:Uncharacterized protein n=1 Tax=Megasphaera paucivorans TaxID=349095 RepID=A0A1G9QUS9_9FIRM|nr:hypothetical protein [Megasphaera paucivorans]SDM14620.1 hypothetical protein SAMN05660299_00285 [Megasphaera paucivorans]
MITKRTEKLWKAALNIIIRPDEFSGGVHYLYKREGTMVLANAYMAVWIQHPNPFNLRGMEFSEMSEEMYRRVFAEPDRGEGNVLQDENTVKHIEDNVLAVFSIAGREVLVSNKLLKRIPYDPREDIVRINNPKKDGPLFFYDVTKVLYGLVMPFRNMKGR